MAQSYDWERDGVRLSIREFDSIKDIQEVEQLEKRCEVGLTGKICLFTDFMGDPLCRVRHNPLYVMLVAELGEHREIVGLIRGCIKTVVRSIKNPEKQAAPTYSKAGYILGLRVSPSHRRMGIGLKLVQSQERWLKENGAEYAYMATEKDNEASMKLFMEKCNFSKFRTPAILVHPVYAHSKRKAGGTQFVKLDPLHAEALYRHCLGATEFFPQDIHHVLNHKLNLGTWVAFPKGEHWQWPTLSAEDITTTAGEGVNVSMPSSWAVVSVWNTSAAFRLQVKGVSLLKCAYAAATRFFDRIFPFVKIPSIPDVFHPFGLHFLYGLHAEGPQKLKLMGDLWWLCHNLAKQKESRKSRVRVIATELSSCDPLRHCIPHWNTFSCPEDLWCIKNLLTENETDRQEDSDWVTSPPGLQIFVDPREF